MTRNKTKLPCAMAYKNRPKRKETSILSSEEDMKAGYDPRTKQVIPLEESSSCHPRELRQIKSDFKSIFSFFLNSQAVLQKIFFLTWICLTAGG
jgi:hypothetical protein